MNVPEWVIRAAYNKAVGLEIAKVTHPIRVTSDGVLTVDVDTREWLAELEGMTDRILARIRAEPNGEECTGIVWRLWGGAPPPAKVLPFAPRCP